MCKTIHKWDKTILELQVYTDESKSDSEIGIGVYLTRDFK